LIHSFRTCTSLQKPIQFRVCATPMFTLFSACARSDRRRCRAGRMLGVPAANMRGSAGRNSIVTYVTMRWLFKVTWGQICLQILIVRYRLPNRVA
jgi:hypothetical protein